MISSASVSFSGQCVSLCWKVVYPDAGGKQGRRNSRCPFIKHTKSAVTVGMMIENKASDV